MLKIKENNLNDNAKYQDYLYKNPKLQYLFFELTDKCNLQCLHCGSRCLRNNYNYLNKELVYKTLDNIKPNNDLMIIFTGGEPLLHRDLFEILEYTNNKGFKIGMTTNGL